MTLFTVPIENAIPNPCSPPVEIALAGL